MWLCVLVFACGEWVTYILYGYMPNIQLISGARSARWLIIHIF